MERALWRLVSRHRRQILGAAPRLGRRYDPAVGIGAALDACGIRGGRGGFCTVANANAASKRVRKTKNAAAGDCHGTTAAPAKESSFKADSSSGETTKETKKVAMSLKKKKIAVSSAVESNVGDRIGADLGQKVVESEVAVSEEVLLEDNVAKKIVASSTRKKKVVVSSTTQTRDADQPKAFEQQQLGLKALEDVLPVSAAATKKPESRHGSKPKKQPEKLDLGKYFQAVGDDGDLFQEEHLDLEKKTKEQPSSLAIPDLVPEGFDDPAGLFQKMVKSPTTTLPYDEKIRLGAVLERFAERGWAKTQALAVYINSKYFPQAVSKFRKFFMAKCPTLLKEVLLKVGPCDEAEEYLFPIFAEFCIAEFSNEMTRYRELVTSADLTKPHAWFPFTRAMKRKVIYHCGPTNSGKTYTALQRFLKAESGIYCCPLRLLAMEIYERTNVAGVYCSLHTGQERREVPFATHLASTVEMAVLSRPWSVAVIDEVQMTADEFRGWAWTKAFLALRADEVHLCGDPSTLELYRTLCAATCDEFVEHHYERFKPLTIDFNSARGNFDYIEAGDCVVAFSRKEIFQVKLEIEQRTKHRCCVVYGALPPETRTHQAKLFNDPSSGYDVLVASDAIGMGLNLNIRRIIFNSLDKFNGEQRVPIPASQVKQIAGRAGRRGSLYPEGYVTTLYASDVPYLVDCMKQPFQSAASAGLFPVFEQLELFASQLPDVTFSQLLDRFSEHCKLDGTYFLCKNDNLKKVAGVLDSIGGLSLEDEYNFCFAPVNSRDPKSMGSLQRFASAYSRKIPVRLSMGMPQRTASDNAGIYDLETRHQLLSMYLWLSQHFPSPAFPERQQAAEMAAKIAEMLGESLVLFTGEEARRRQEETEREQRGCGRERESVRQPHSRLSLQMQTMRKQLCVTA